jgi:hypothetical protein
VGVITGRPSALAWEINIFCTQRDLRQVRFNAEVAPGHHDAVGSLDDCTQAAQSLTLLNLYYRPWPEFVHLAACSSAR